MIERSPPWWEPSAPAIGRAPGFHPGGARASIGTGAPVRGDALVRRPTVDTSDAEKRARRAPKPRHGAGAGAVRAPQHEQVRPRDARPGELSFFSAGVRSGVRVAARGGGGEGARSRACVRVRSLVRAFVCVRVETPPGTARANPGRSCWSCEVLPLNIYLIEVATALLPALTWSRFPARVPTSSRGPVIDRQMASAARLRSDIFWRNGRSPGRFGSAGSRSWCRLNPRRARRTF